MAKVSRKKGGKVFKKKALDKQVLQKSERSSEWTISHFADEEVHYDNARNKEILDYFENLNLLTEEDRKTVMNYYLNKGLNIAEAILSLGSLEKEDVGRAIADYFDTTHINLKNTRIAPEVALVIPEEVSKSEGALAYAEDENGIHVAMVNPANRHFLHLLEKKTGKKVIAQYAMPGEIDDAQKIYTQDALSSFQYLITRATENIGKLETLSNISSIFDTVVLMAYYRNASDIHIEPFEYEIRIRLRVDGVLSNIASLPTNFLDTMVNHVKVLSKLRTDEHNAAQDGRFKINFDNAVINFRVSILPSYFGEKIVLRLLSSESQEMTLEELGYSANDVRVIERNIQKTQGMNLVTGPTGSGKTTTLYSILEKLNKENVNISTIEDPIEYGIYGMNQVQVNLKKNITFADGLRSLLRQDPDIMMIGEIRDLDTAKISAHASLTGHLIFATLHTSSASLAPLRLVQMGLDPYLILSTLNMIIAQRLVRTICPSCMVTYNLSREEVEAIGKKYFSTAKEKAFFKKWFKTGKGGGLRLYKGNGCKECDHSGFRGRTVVAEVMEINHEIHDLIVAEASREEIEEAAVRNGMVTMLEDGINKVFEGITTLNELFRVINQ